MAKWLVKADPEDFSIEDLRAAGSSPWDGVRNYQARNFIREMRVGDDVLIYHSGKKPAVVGLGRVGSEPYPDPTQFDPASDYFDPKSTADDPRWVLVDVQYVKTFEVPVSLAAIKSCEALGEMLLVKRSRLSVMPVAEREYELIAAMAGEES